MPRAILDPESLMRAAMALFWSQFVLGSFLGLGHRSRDHMMTGTIGLGQEES